ncbi:MAG: DUF1269 domain-containing protein [Patescibacteria group bacterium]
MADILLGIFTDSKQAGNAVAEFVNKDLAQDITIVAKDDLVTDTGTEHVIKKDVSRGSIAGAATGAAVGGIAGLLAGASSFALPGLGLIALGPIASVLAGAGGGATAGGIVGALVDYGLPDEKARLYQQRVQAGEVLVGVLTNRIMTEDARAIMEKHDVDETQTIRMK